MKTLLIASLLVFSTYASAVEYTHIKTTGNGFRIGADGNKSQDGWNGTWRLITSDTWRLDAGDTVEIQYKHDTEANYKTVYRGCTAMKGGILRCADKAQYDGDCAVSLTVGFHSGRRALISQMRACPTFPAKFTGVTQELGTLE
jgi:hypothetical protein